MLRHRYLIPLCPATLESEQDDETRVRYRPRADWRQFDARRYPRFSDADLLDALFSNDRASTLAVTGR